MKSVEIQRMVARIISKAKEDGCAVSHIICCCGFGWAVHLGPIPCFWEGATQQLSALDAASDGYSTSPCEITWALCLISLHSFFVFNSQERRVFFEAYIHVSSFLLSRCARSKCLTLSVQTFTCPLPPPGASTNCLSYCSLFSMAPSHTETMLKQKFT